ncbi:hypothetical protein SUGI_0128890 [Cryptomeria japonica]|nr:hypothetical protein SUGI_0128890 [Cryptomeria japonica]
MWLLQWLPLSVVDFLLLFVWIILADTSRYSLGRAKFVDGQEEFDALILSTEYGCNMPSLLKKMASPQVEGAKWALYSGIHGKKAYFPYLRR